VATNTAVGASALGGGSQTGTNNTALGYQALLSNTTGDENSALSSGVLRTNTTGARNTGAGLNALYANTTGSDNSAFGRGTLQTNTTGSNNAAFGKYAMLLNTTGANNTAHGTEALYSNTTASDNTAVGYQAGYSNTIGAASTFLGYRAGFSLNRTADVASYNTMLGALAGYFVTTGQQNTFVGEESGYSMTTGSKNTIVGRYNGNQDGLDIRTASNYIVLSDGDGNVEFTAKDGSSWALPGAVPQTGTGITFPATQSASTNANTLDDYEEGTWTPQLTGSGGGDYTMSGSNSGKYIRVGRIVTVEAVLQWSGGGPFSGTLQVNGLPFTNSGGVRSMGSFGWSNGTSIIPNSTYTWITVGIDLSASAVSIIQNGVLGNSGTPTVAASGVVFGFGLTYLAS
jgi:hypothetical protein